MKNNDSSAVLECVKTCDHVTVVWGTRTIFIPKMNGQFDFSQLKVYTGPSLSHHERSQIRDFLNNRQEVF